MKKNFTVILPDEPYKTTTVLNNTVQCTYEGGRYVIARMEDSSKKVLNSVRVVDSLDDVELNSFIEEGHSFFVVDATINPFEAAVITHSYTHGNIADYEETLPTGEKWSYKYEDGTGIIENIYQQFTLEYDPATQAFKEPNRRVHSISRESFFSGMETFPAKIQAALDINDYTDEERTSLENYKTWLENLSTTYANVDHWKITFPANLPQY